MYIETSTQELGNDIGRMQEWIGNLITAKDQVYRCLEGVNSMWEGPAKTVFMSQTRVDEMVLVGLIDNLNNLVTCMEFAKREYEKCAEDVNSKIAGIRLSNDT